MELHQIRYFLALAEELNFTRAAQRCGVAQSSLTRGIKALEDEVGGTLFHRRHARTYLSPLGERLQPVLAQAWRHVCEAEREAREFTRMQRPLLRLGLMRSIAPARLVGLIAALRARHPEVALQFTEDTRESLQAALLARELDAAIYAPAHKGGDARLAHQPLYRESFLVVVGAGHRLARRDMIRLDDLAGETCLGGPDDAGGPDAAGARDGERVDWILAMAGAGLGYGIVPAESVGPDIVALRLAPPGLVREIVLATRCGEEASPALAALRQHAAHLPWAGEAAAPRVHAAALAAS